MSASDDFNPIAAGNGGALSSVHAMLDRIERHGDAGFLNAVVNDPSVYPWVCGAAQGPLDLGDVVADPANVLLMGEHGGILFVQLQPGLYEAHTQVLPSGRGAWTVGMVQAALHWMFTRTPAVEIVTRVPHGNYPARALVKAIHGVFEFRNERGWNKDGEVIPADLFALTIQHWMKTASGLIERGRWFHERLIAEYERLGKVIPQHADDDVHDRYAGAAADMMLGRQPQKAVVFYNRWARMSGYEPISLVNLAPPILDIRDCLLAVADDDFQVIRCQ